MKEAHGFSIFSDDIRHEVGGKLSIIGAYADVLISEEFPLNLAKLGIFTSLFIPFNYGFSKLSFVAFLGRDEIARTDFPPLPKDLTEKREEILEARMGFEPQDYEEDRQRFTVVRNQFYFSPLEIAEPCVLRVRAVLEGETIKAGRLLIMSKSAFDAREAVTQQIISRTS